MTIFTELFGVQSYIINGVRTSSKKSQGKASLFQAAAILDLVVYHNEIKNLQRIKDSRWSVLYQHIFSDIPKNAVAMFMVELLTKCLKQPEANPELFYFIEDAFLHLDNSDENVMANFPLFFAIHLAVLLGFRIDDNYDEQHTVLDLMEGNFVSTAPDHSNYLEGKQAWISSQVLKMQQPAELKELKLNSTFRRSLLQAYETFYAVHVQDFGSLKTLPVLKEILS